jgi:AraC-like DNA-binding protein
MIADARKVTAPVTRSIADPTVVASYVRALLELAVSKGAAGADLLARSRIDMRELDDPDNRVSLQKFAALMRAGKDLSGDPALALHFGEAFDCTELSIVSLAGQGCATMGDAFALHNRLSRLLVEVDVRGGGDRFTLTRDKAGVWLVDNRENANDFPEITESGFARMACAGRGAGAPALMKAVHVTHAEPSYRAEYERIFQVPVVFGADRNAILMSNDAWLTQKLAPQPRYVTDMLSARAAMLVRKLEDSKSFRGRVEALLKPVLHTGGVGMDAIAGQLGVSPRTLSRRLKAEGVTFEAVLDALRHKLAIHYLTERKVSVNETASLVGYSEHAAFSRAFKRWTGSLPGAMRAPRAKKTPT